MIDSPCSDPASLMRLLDVIEHDIAPMTEMGVERGNKVFGAAILCKSDLSLVLAETNNEVENPLWHGEVHVLKRYYELPRQRRPAPEQCVFIATHEPCSLCLSAITWTGFDNFHYLFSHEESRDEFNIPHDLRILKEAFKLGPGEYNRSNAFWNAYSIRQLAGKLSPTDRKWVFNRIDVIAAKYDVLSERYQRNKDATEIPLN